MLSDAIREGTDVADTLEDRARAYGQYLLAKVFGDDTREALDLRTKNPVWTELVRHAGGPTLKLSRKVLDVALRRDRRRANPDERVVARQLCSTRGLVFEYPRERWGPVRR